MRTASIFLGACIIGATTLTACSTAPDSPDKRRALVRDAEDTVDDFLQADPGMQKFFDDCHAYAVFPGIGRGGFIVGGSYGRGVTFKDGKPTGYADITSGEFGFLAGGQGFREIIFFQHPGEYRDFKDGRFSLKASASAVLVTSGASATTKYDEGIAVFIMGERGAMLDASVGGQGFSWRSMDYYNE